LANKKGENRSYFSVGRRRRKKNLMIIIPIVAALAVTLIFVSNMSTPAIHGNQMVLHNHVSLKVTSDGQPVVVPAHVGMGQVGKGENPLLYGDHSLDEFGMQGMSPLHTHDASGTIHVESNVVRNFTLGELLDLWQGLDFNGKTVQVSVNGKAIPDNRNIILKDGEKIDLDIKS
jgi:sulfur carrier protein ThiS